MHLLPSPEPYGHLQPTADQSRQDKSAGAGADICYMPERLTLFDLLIQGKKKLRRREVFKHKSWQKNPHTKPNQKTNQPNKKPTNYSWCLQFPN